MNEQEETKGEKPKESEAKPDNGDKPEELSVIERTNVAVERAEKAAEALKAENDRSEKLYAEDKLAGTGGVARTEDKPKEETPAEYRDRVMKGDLNG